MYKHHKISIFRFITQVVFLSLFVFGLVTFKSLMLFLIISSIILGPFFCGWMCFFGFYQDICRYAGSIFKKAPIEPSEKLQNILKFSRYLILLASVTIGGIFLFPNKVWGGFAGYLKGHIEIDFVFYFLILLGILSLFTRRFFCRYLCPFGAKLGLYSLLRPITINKSASCASCGICKSICPMGIPLDKTNSLANPNCINCLKCIEVCPENCLKLGIRNYLKP